METKTEESMSFTREEIIKGLRELYTEWCQMKAREEGLSSIRLPDYEKMLDELEQDGLPEPDEKAERDHLRATLLILLKSIEPPIPNSGATGYLFIPKQVLKDAAETAGLQCELCGGSGLPDRWPRHWCWKCGGTGYSDE